MKSGTVKDISALEARAADVKKSTRAHREHWAVT